MKNSLIFGGDLVPCGDGVELFESGDVEAILGRELLDIWDGADFRFFNLECPITNSEEKITKCGPNLKCTPKNINGIKLLSPTCVFLSNNHIMDYSSDGLRDTINILEKKNIDWIGVGRNIDSLKKTFSFNCSNFRVGIYNCCEREFSVASDDKPGANPYDDLSICGDLIALKEKNDYVIVVYHGGKEHYRYPSPDLQKRCRKMIEYGASLVICQHSHCIGCEEKYNNGTIVYGQGNFVFNKQQNEFWNTSLLIGVNFQNGLTCNYIPIVQTPDGCRLANEKETKRIIDDYKHRSEKIKSKRLIENEYQKYADSVFTSYLMRLNHGIIMKILWKICPGFLVKHFYDFTSILNILECEAHRELFIEGLKNTLENKK